MFKSDKGTSSVDFTVKDIKKGYILEYDLKNWGTITIEKVNSIKDKLNIPRDFGVRMIDMNSYLNERMNILYYERNEY